jgi:hypothetical protein
MFSWGQARKPLAELREKGRGFRGKKEGGREDESESRAGLGLNNIKSCAFDCYLLL